MGTKKPAAAGPAAKKQARTGGAECAATKRPRAVEGVDITRFFDRRDAGEPQGHQQHNQQQQQPLGDGTDGGKSVSPLGGGDGAQNATERTPGAAAARPALHKHLSTLQDLGPADSFAMSQDTDAMQVVWQDSPGSSSRPQARSLSNLGGRSSGSGAQEIKQRLISAAQRPRDVRRPASGGAFAGSAGGVRLQHGEQLLEGLLTGRPQAGAAPPGAAAAAPEHSAASGAPSEPSGGVGGASHRTPGTHLRGILKRTAAGSGSAGRHTPASTVKFRADSSGKGRRRVQANSSGKKRSAGQKRKALLELLEQVESFVHSSASPEGGKGSCADGGDAEADGAFAAAAATAAAAAADEAGVASDKENVVGGAVGGKPARASQGQAGSAPLASGPTGSQQLMPPPAARPPPAAEAQRLPVPLAPAPAGPEDHVAARAVRPLQPPAAAAATGGFGEDEDEDDALMAQLELELLTQVEQRHAGRQAAGGAGQARHGHAAPPAGLPRPQAAPPAAQHPAAAAGLQQGMQQRAHGPAPAQRLHMPVPQQALLPQQAASRQHTPAQQEGPPEQQCQQGPPRSPYDRALPPPAALVVAPAAADGTDLPPTQPAAAAAEAQGSDSSWEDDFDGALLDQFEAAALKERASGGGGGGGVPAVAEGGVPPGGQAAPAPRFPGGREQVYYTITEVYPPTTKQVLRLHSKYQNRDVYAHLKTPWCDLPFRVGDPVNLLARVDFFEGHYHSLLDMETGMLILHPDVLLSGTRITTSHECTRRSFLDERVAESGGSNDKAVKGTLTHNLIQTALTEGLRTLPQLVAAAERVVGEATEALLEVELTEEAAMECLRQAMPGVQRWMHRFLRAEPAPDSLLAAGMDYGNGREMRRAVAVPEVVDIEESIWSTKFGVKGMIDVSARLALQDPSQRPRQGPGSGGWMQAAGSGGGGAPTGGAPGRELAIGPIEIKTGKPHGSHHAQVLLYLLLMEERYGRPLDWGMLWYTGQPDPLLIMKRPTDLSCLLAVRNRLAAAIAHREMPPLTDEKRQCNWCFQQANCMVAHAAQRGAAAATPDSFVRPFGDRGAPLDNVQQELAGKYERAAGHMTGSDCEFLRKWEALVTLEEGRSSARRPEVWAMAGEERQALGRCVAGLALSHVDEEQLLYTFCRQGGGALQCGFAEGEMLLLSVEGQHAAVARGFFYTCSATHLTVTLNKALRRGLLRPGATPAEGAAPPAGPGPAGGAPAPQWDASVRWRLDRDEVASTFVRLRGNLFALFRREFELSKDPKTNRVVQGEELASSLQAARLRQLVVGLAAPRYAAPDPTQPDPTPAGMNSEQAAGVRRVSSAQDYTLVLGMPGAGKTTTIVSMVQALVAQGKSVLLTSYTNSAVDNILMKLAREEVPFVRLGRESGVHPAVRPWLPGGERYQRRTTRDLAALARVPVFGATCFGVHHPLIKRRMFDVCIIDEAGQMMLPAALGPLLRARSFVLVGDHNQLPPLVTCKEAEAGGLGESLFKRLSEAHPQAVVSLPVQYRMAADIMLLPNQLIYNNQLRCGTDGIAQAMLQLSHGAAATLASQPAWLQAALDPRRRVLFLDTSAVEGARESVAGDAVSNPGEARLVLRMLSAAVSAGVPPSELGVISPYRSQVALLDRQAREARLEGVEALTVDKCQGRDKEAIVLSLVRSNAEGEAGKLLTDWRRINVAITRAKCKLVLVGDAATLASIDLFARLVALVRQQGWYLPLPADALAAQ